jgi:predicted PurR-regulated permease PerM
MAQVSSSFDPASPGSKTETIVITSAVIAGLYFGSEILVPIALAILLSFVLAPAVRMLHKLGLGRVMPVAITVVLTVLVLAALGGLIAAQLRDLSNDLPRFETTLIGKVQALRGVSNGGFVHKLEVAAARFSSAFRPQAEDGNTATRSSETAPGPNAPAPSAPAPMPVQVIQPPMAPVETAVLLLKPLLHPLSTAFIVLIFVIFILLQREDLRNRAIRLFGASDLQRTTAAINDGAKRLSRYLLTQCAVNVSAGLVVGCALWLIGVPSPILLGILFACLRFVPYVGPVIGSVMPVFLAAAADPGWSTVLWTIAALAVVELVIGQLVEPYAYGHNTGLSPVAIIVAATFWTVLWGPVGLLLSTPLTVCLVVLGRHVEQLAFLDVLFGDRPPLSHTEVFYQRMLANDPVEASDHAQRCLEDMSIAHYLDNVALPALLMAQEDVGQGRLDLARQSQIQSAALEVVEDMDLSTPATESHGKLLFWQVDHRKGEEQKNANGDRPTGLVPDEVLPEEPPPHLRREGSVLCVGARGPLDDAAATMLAQVLVGHGIGARADAHTRLSKAEIGSLEVAGVELIILSTLDGSSPAFLRFILRRLRRRAPKATILIGAWWRRSGPRETDDELDEAITDPKVASFIDAVRYCLSHTAEGGEGVSYSAAS